MHHRGHRRGALWRVRALDRAVSFSVEELESRRLLSAGGAEGSPATHFATIPAGNITIYVDQNATGGNTGADWADAYTSLQTALSAAGADSPSSNNTITINVAEGTYSPGSSPTNTFQLLDDVTLNGGYPTGGAMTGNPTQFPTVLFGGVGVNETEVTATATDATAVLDGFTIENLEDFSNKSTANGGGMLIGTGSPTIDNCTFSEDYALNGGAVYNNGSPTFNNCTFSSDSCGDNGGAMYNAGSASAILNNCTFTDNDEAYNVGGAIADFSSSSLTMTNGSIDGAFSGALPNGPEGDGAGIYVQSTGTVSITNVTFDRNGDNGNGTAIDLVSSGTANITNCVFIDNSGSGTTAGGAIYTSSTGAFTLVDCAFTGNLGDVGQGMYVVQGSPSLINCTFSGNGSTFYDETGAAFYVAGGSPTLTNCILYGDTAEISGNPTVTDSDIEGDFTGTGNIGYDPMFSTVANGTQQLTAHSPAINAGSNAAVPGGVTTDAAGNPRIVGGVVDMGAYEFQGVNSAPVIVSGATAGFAMSATNSFTLIANAFPPATFMETPPLPAGVTLTNIGGSEATISGVPTGGTNVYNITIIASNGLTPDATQQFTLTIGVPPSISSTNSYTFTNGQTGSFTVTTTGTPTAALMETGALPTGVTFTDNGDGTATLSGTPAAGPGSIDDITITADNGIAPAGTQTFVLTVNGAPTITSSSVIFLQANDDEQDLTITTGGPTPAIAETGALPNGLTFTDNGDGTASIQGTPLASDLGTYTFVVTATNSFGTATQNVTLTVTPVMVYVDPSATGENDGQDWADAFTDLTTAFEEFSDADNNEAVQFNVAAGTYVPNNDNGNFNTFEIPEYGAFQLVGGFAPGGSPTPDPSQYVTTLSGGGTDYNVVISEATLSTVSGFTISDGDADGINSFQKEGAGIVVLAGTLTVVNCTFTSNMASTGGGAISTYQDNAPLTVNNSTFTGNSGAQDGGAISTSAPTVLTDCTFTSNTALNAGAVYLSGGSVLINCLFVGNSVSGDGGAAYVFASTNHESLLLNCTFNANEAANAGGAVVITGQGATVTNCILYGDGAPSDTELYDVPQANITYSDIQQSGITGMGDIDADPMFADAPVNLQLASGSPCINAGSNAAVPVAVTTDIAGNPRISGGTVDMGAYELQPAGAITIYVDQSATGQNDGQDWADAFTSLDSALGYVSENIGSNTPVDIDVAAGTYVPSNSSFETPGISGNLMLIGGYAPGGSAMPNPNQNVTTLSEGGVATNFNVIIDDSPSLTLSGFTVINGKANGGSDPQDAGGGINVVATSGSLTISNCSFMGNQAVDGGGAIYVASSMVSLSVSDTEFDNNSATAATSTGGAVDTMSASSTFTGCVFEGNTASFGGAIDAQRPGIHQLRVRRQFDPWLPGIGDWRLYRIAEHSQLHVHRQHLQRRRDGRGRHQQHGDDYQLHPLWR
ncbi:MAG: right-handed parallel beta-helix repeat-containing protein [Tepidisphaeraceae bacterium]